MFNFVNRNPFGQKIESAVSTGQEQKREHQQNRDDEERNYLEDDDGDEVSISQQGVLSEDDIKYLVKEYISRLKSEHEGEDKIIQKLDKFLSKFDVKKFMKNNPNMTYSDFNMIMFNETADIIK